MALIVADLADAINSVLGGVDKDGNPISTTPFMTAYASAVISALQAALFSHLPGTVTGTAPAAPGPVPDLAASNGLAVVNSAPWLAEMTSGFPGADGPTLSTEATASTGYLTGASVITFNAGDLTGDSTAVGPPTPAPGVLVFTATATPGVISGLSASDWANIVLPPGGDLSLTTDIYDAIVDYIINNAECEYAAGTVNGTFPAVSSPLTGGSGVGGTIS